MPAEFPTIPYLGPAAARYGSYSKRYMVVHCTSNTAPPRNECLYAMRRTDGVGLHFCSDRSMVLQGLESWYGTGHVGSTAGNRYGIAWEFVGLTSYSATYWQECIDVAAAAMRLPMARHGIPHRWLTDAELRGGSAKGLVTHLQCSRVLGGSDHTDPGPNFPRQYLIDALNGAHEMTTPLDPYNDPTIRTIADRVDAMRGMNEDYEAHWNPAGPTPETNELAVKINAIHSVVSAGGVTLEMLTQAVKLALLDPEVLAGLTQVTRNVVDQELDEAFTGARDDDPAPA
jgi:hypothetical protein